jgi:hypothetical protein
METDAFHCGREINEEGEEKRKMLAFACGGGGRKEAKAARKGGWDSTFTRVIITSECGKNMMKNEN